MSSEVTEKKSHKWSYSNIAMLRSCQRKFAFKYLMKVRPDVPDESDAFLFGTVFHAYLELTRHTCKPRGTAPAPTTSKFKEVTVPCLVDEGLLSKVIEEELKTENKQWSSSELALLKLRVGASLQAYFLRHNGSGLTCIASEIEVGGDDFVGFVDVVFTDPLGRWWITDLKTSSSVKVDVLVNRLPSDLQLGLYTLYANQIAEKLGLSMNMFAGVRYITTTKTSSEFLRPFEEFCVKNSTKSYDFAVLKEHMIIDENVLKSAKESLKEIESEDNPLNIPCNRGSCMEYFKPCVYWSYCHGGKPHGSNTDSVQVILDSTQYEWSIDSLI